MSNLRALPTLPRNHHALREAAFICHMEMAVNHMRHGEHDLAAKQARTGLQILDEAWPETAEERRPGTAATEKPCAPDQTHERTGPGPSGTPTRPAA